MKTVILHGSPRKNGDTAYLLQRGLSYLAGTTVYYNLYDENIQPCIDCRYCLEQDHCFMEDNMDVIIEDLFDADAVIVASPIYFAALTGEFLNFASRLQFLFGARYIRKEPIPIKRKRGILILSGGGSGGEACARQSALVFFHEINCKLIETIYTLQTDLIPAKADEQAIEAIKNGVLQLNGSVEISKETQAET